MEHDFLSQIEASSADMSKRQRLLAQYISSHSAEAAYMTASALANAAGVSESTVVRFAAALGYDGYPEMQKHLKEALRVRMTTVERIEAASGILGKGDTVSAVLTADAEKIMSTLRELDRTAFEKTVDMLMSARKIYIVGMRSSAMLAQFMNYYLRLLFDNVSLVCPTGGSEVFEHLINLSEGDVVFAISFPRYSSGTVRATEYAKRVGAGVAVLTDSKSSPIASYADAILEAKSEMASFVDSLVAPMSIINAIIAYIGKKDPARASAKFRHLEKVWNEYQVYSK